MQRATIDQLRRITPEERAYLAGKQGADMSYYSRTQSLVDQARLLPPGHLCGMRMHARFVRFPRHRHNYVEMVYMLSGHTTHIIDGRETLELHAGNLMILNQTVEHEILPAGQDDLAVNFILLPRFFDATAAALDAENPLWLFLMNAGQRGVPDYLVFDVASSVPVQNLLENLILLLQAGGTERGEIEQATLSLLLQHLAGYSDHLVVRTRAEEQHALVLRALAYIEEHYRLCSLQELAARERTTDCRLSRLLKAETGCTFTELLHTVRFARATTLLRNTDLPVTEVAAAVGYENAAFFYRRFAARFGCTPAQYRAAHRSEQEATS